MPCRSLRTVLLCSALTMLAACNLTQLAYNRLYTIARWRVGQYVTFDPAQRQTFDAGFRAFWAWNRQTQLPRYASALREIAARVDQPPDTNELGQWSDRYGALWSASLERLLPLACTLGTSLSDEQVARSLQQVAGDIVDYADEKVEPTLRSDERRVGKE